MNDRNDIQLMFEVLNNKIKPIYIKCITPKKEVRLIQLNRESENREWMKIHCSKAVNLLPIDIIRLRIFTS